MEVTTVNDAVIDSISFSSDSFLSDLNPTEENKGIWRHLSGIWKWKANPGQSVNNLTFVNYSIGTLIKEMAVYYTLPVEMLLPDARVEDKEFKNNDVLPSFKEMNLIFDRNIKELDASKIKIRGEKIGEKTMTATPNGNVVTLSLDEAIVEHGIYTITVPASSFQDTEGFQNKELVYTFKVAFNYVTVDPVPGEKTLESITDGIVITYPDNIGYVNSDSIFTLKKDGVAQAPMYAEKAPDDEKGIILKFKNINSGTLYTEEGEYTIDVPEKVVYNAFYGMDGESYNLPFTLTYSVEPEPDSETMTAAKKLLEVFGVGYPAEASAARVALKALVESEEIPADEVLQKAIDAFYNETNITLPESGKYYAISNVNTKGDAIYLAYSNGVVSLTKDKVKAARFEAELKDNGSVVFQTLDGKYLHALTTLATNFEQTTTANVTTAYNATVNDLTLAKLIVDGAKKPEDLLGKMSIYGCLGENKVDNNEVSTYVVIGHTNTVVATDARYGKAPIFEENLSSAFVLEEVEVVSLTAELTPTIVTSNTNPLTLKITSDTPVVLATTVAAYFKDKEGKHVGTASITAVEEKDNEFTVSLVGLVDGTYTLVIPDGMFTTEKDDQTVHVAVLGEMTFTIDVTEAFITEFYPAIYNDKFDYVYDTFFNDFILVSEAAMFVDETKEVKIVEYWNVTNVIRVGHMQPIKVEGYPYACKLIFDEPIVAGELLPDQYTIMLEEATVGDASFSNYLKDPTFVKKSECNVNPHLSFTYKVDNTMTVAQELLKVSGVGYPAEASNARVYLENLLDSPFKPSEEELQVAIKAFYAETDITMPESGKYYTISNVNTKGDAIYLAYADGAVSLTKDKDNAARFTAEPKDNGTVVFQTLDGKYLHALTAADNFDLTTPANVTTAYNATVNDLKLTKLDVSGAKQEDLLGKMSIYGCLGTNSNDEQEVSTYVVVRHPDTTVATDANYGAAPTFTENLSSAFVIEEVGTVTVETVTLAAELTPITVAGNTEKLTLKFTSESPVVMIKTAAAYFADEEGKRVAIASITAVEGKDDEFTVSLNGLSDGTYTLVLPEATFTTKKDDRKAYVAALELTFTIEIAEAVEVVSFEAKLSPGIVTSNTETLTLKITSDTPIVLANATAAYFNKDGEDAGAASIEAVEGTNNEFTVLLTGLSDGIYTLHIPEATFTTEKAGKTVHVAAMVLGFKIDSSVIDEFKEEFYPAIYNDKQDYVFDIFFNDYILVSEAPMCVDETKEVRLVHCTETDSVLIRAGHMESISEGVGGYPYACKFVFDEPIKIGELQTGKYAIIIEEATVGDANFGEYLKDPSSVKKLECNVNPRFTFTYDVDNYKATEKIEVLAKLTSSTVANNTEKLTLKFTWDAPVEMTDTINAHFEDAEGKNVGIASITKVAGSDTEFTVSLDGLADGTYTLVIPEAKFTTEKEGKPAHVAAMKLTFTIETEEFMKEFWSEIYNEQETYFDTDLNNRILVSRIPMCVDETKEVCLVHCTETDSVVVRTGHMELLPEGVEGKLYACQFVLDEPIETGDLETGKYTIILEEATIGNANFGKYLADPTSVKKSQCNVNPRLTFDYNVDNKATAITDINADGNAEKVIYTITGRRVKNMNAPGIYIVNGKKVLKK